MNEMLAFSCLSFFTVRNSFRFCMKFIILLSALVHIPSITWALQNAFLWPIPQSVKSGQVDVPLEVRSFYGLVIVCISQLTPDIWTSRALSPSMGLLLPSWIKPLNATVNLSLMSDGPR